MLIIRTRERRFSKHTKRHKASSLLSYQHRHGRVDQIYHRDHQPITSQHTDALSTGQQTVSSKRALPYMVKESYVAWFDGSCEPINPGGTGRYGVVIKDNAGRVLLKECNGS